MTIASDLVEQVEAKFPRLSGTSSARFTPVVEQIKGGPFDSPEQAKADWLEKFKAKYGWPDLQPPGAFVLWAKKPEIKRLTEEKALKQSDAIGGGLRPGWYHYSKLAAGGGK